MCRYEYVHAYVEYMQSYHINMYTHKIRQKLILFKSSCEEQINENLRCYPTTGQYNSSIAFLSLKACLCLEFW